MSYKLKQIENGPIAIESILNVNCSFLEGIIDSGREVRNSVSISDLAMTPNLYQVRVSVPDDNAKNT